MAKDADSGRKGGREMEWLYKSPQVDREQYLLGRKIDRQVDPLLASEEKEKQALATGPGALFTGPDGAGSTADLATKIKEDPLFLIKKKEEEARRRLASNPVKMKQLHQLLAQEKSSKSKKKRDRSRSPRKKRHSPHRKSKKSHKHKREPSSPPAPSHTPPSTSVRHLNSSSSSRPPTRPRSSGLGQEELEKRRKEMMADAESHGREREQRLRRLERDRQREEKESVSSHSKDFLQPLRVQSMAAAGSVEERIHRNIGSVQRTRTKLDGNFLHK